MAQPGVSHSPSVIGPSAANSMKSMGEPENARPPIGPHGIRAPWHSSRAGAAMSSDFSDTDERHRPLPRSPRNVTTYPRSFGIALAVSPSTKDEGSPAAGPFFRLWGRVDGWMRPRYRLLVRVVRREADFPVKSTTALGFVTRRTHVFDDERLVDSPLPGLG